MSRLSSGGVFLAVGFVFVLVGCKAESAKLSTEERHLKAIAILAGRYRSLNRGQEPANLDALKAFARKADAAMLQSIGVEPGETDSLFVSSRDGKPFVYRPSKGSGVPTPGPDGKMIQKVILHEQEGSGGKRWVAYETTQAEEVDADRFAKLVPSAR
jgi:hypothetical protein